MKTDFELSQAEILNPEPSDYEVDPQIRPGICFALSVEWCRRILENEDFRPPDIRNVLFQMFSRQRAYNWTYEEKIRNFAEADEYKDFYDAAELASHNFVNGEVKHWGMLSGKKVEEEEADPSQIVSKLSRKIGPGKACILGFFCVHKATQKNCAHATAIGCRDDGNQVVQFFDPNAGQFSWEHETHPNRISADIVNRLIEDYKEFSLKDFVVYGMSKRGISAMNPSSGSTSSSGVATSNTTSVLVAATTASTNAEDALTYPSIQIKQ